MKLIVVLHGYGPERAEEMKDIILMLLEAAEIDDTPIFEELPAISAGGPYLEIIVERKSSIYPIVEQFYVQRVYEMLEISGAATFFFEPGDFMSTAWVKKVSRYKRDHEVD